VIFALVYSHPWGNRFALVFIKQHHMKLVIRPVDLGRVNVGTLVRMSPESQSRNSSEDESHNYQATPVAPKILQVLEYRLESYFQDLRGSQEPVVNQETNNFLIFPVILQICNESNVCLDWGEVTLRGSHDDLTPTLRISVARAPKNADPDWEISGI
jgi:hypothetical protein